MYIKVIQRKNRGKIFVFLTLGIVLASLVCWYVYYYHEPLLRTKVDYDILINEASKRYSIDPSLLKAVIWQESRFQANITGSHNEIGLMQIRPEYGATSDWLKKNNMKLSCRGILYMPELNIEIGAWYLGRALKRWAGYKYQYELALSEYNAGFKGMQPWVPKKQDGEVIQRITIPSTKAYIIAIMTKYREYAAKKQTE